MNETHQPHGSKAPFVAPKLEIYGRARDITRAIGIRGNLDLQPAGTVNIRTTLI